MTKPKIPDYEHGRLTESEMINGLDDSIALIESQANRIADLEKENARLKVKIYQLQTKK